MRPSPAQAKAKVNQYISFLEEHGVPTALFKQRVKDIVDWGESVRFRKPNPAAPKSPEMKGIQSALDEMCRSEKYVRDQRRGGYSRDRRDFGRDRAQDQVLAQEYATAALQY